MKSVGTKISKISIQITLRNYFRIIIDLDYKINIIIVIQKHIYLNS